jgi:hypothetical protein
MVVLLLTLAFVSKMIFTWVLSKEHTAAPPTGEAKSRP